MDWSVALRFNFRIAIGGLQFFNQKKKARRLLFFLFFFSFKFFFHSFLRVYVCLKRRGVRNPAAVQEGVGGLFALEVADEVPRPFGGMIDAGDTVLDDEVDVLVGSSFPGMLGPRLCGGAVDQ